MARRGDVPTRGEVTEKVEHNANDMQEKAEDVDKIVEDIETVRQTLEELDLGGTSDGAEKVERSIDAAEDVTVDVFDREDEEVEQLQEDTSEYEDDLGERSDTVESDLGKISDASGRIETQETTNELVNAKEAAIHDIEFLSDQARRAEEARAESERIQQDHQSRAHSGRKS